jgi:riboflavin synthase
VEKGSVAVDGISLTAIGTRPGRFSVAVIPHTFRATTLSNRRRGDALNFEADAIAKYVESLLAGRRR